MLTAQAYFNGDDCFLAWDLPETKGCWGVSIWRRLERDGRVDEGYIDNWTGFADDKPKPHERRPSSEWPFQRYTWTDHGVSEGDSVTYKMSPVVQTAAGLTPDDAKAATIGPLNITAEATATTSAYFNRGILLSQFMTTHLPANFTKSDLAKLKTKLADSSDTLRAFLTGQLGARLLKLLDDARANRQHVYAVLYELDDQALIDRLLALGKRAHVVLSNGSSKTKGSDGNQAAADQLDGVIDLHRRMLWSEGLGHNKFAVIAESATRPVAVWTGSTNWSMTGLCTQMNNGVLIEDADVAQDYLDQWKLLRDDGRTGPQGQPLHFGPDLMAANDQPKDGHDASTGDWTVWFTRTRTGADLDEANQLINGAQHALLFLMFEPGSNGLLQTVQARLSPASPTYDPDLYLHGVVNTLQPSANAVSVNVVSRGQAKPFDLALVQPEGIDGGQLAEWAAEVTRRDFLSRQGGVIGFAIIHSKIIVIDPFTNPIVITGSHNFSQSASAKNDENLIIIRDNPKLAERYAVNIMATYQHYRFRSYIKDCRDQGISPWQGLVKADTWQASSAEHADELRFWVAQK